MTLRRRVLPRGWYPDDAKSVRDLVASWLGAPQASANALAAVGPHAGWAFSGRLAAQAVAALGPAETVVVVGGHLPASARPLVATEDSFDTPLGPIAADAELRTALGSVFGRALGKAAGRGSGAALAPDDFADNTVEIQLPLVKALLPDAGLLWLRAPNGAAAGALGAALFEAASQLGRRIVCLGSTDLTHYGASYGFSPRGKGEAAEAWVRDVNDKALVDALLAMDGDAVLKLGEENRAACSSGAAAAAVAFAKAAGASRAELLGYATSLDVRRDESFVGYAAIGFYA